MENKSIYSVLAEANALEPESSSDLHSIFGKWPIQLVVMSFLVIADLFGFYGVLNSIFVDLSERIVVVLTAGVSAMTLVSGIFVGWNIKLSIDERFVKVFSAVKAAGLAIVVFLLILAVIECRKATQNGLLAYKDVVDWEAGVYFMGAMLLASFIMTVVMSITKEEQ